MKLLAECQEDADCKSTAKDYRRKFKTFHCDRTTKGKGRCQGTKLQSPEIFLYIKNDL